MTSEKTKIKVLVFSPSKIISFSLALLYNQKDGECEFEAASCYDEKQLHEYIDQYKPNVFLIHKNQIADDIFILLDTIRLKMLCGVERSEAPPPSRSSRNSLAA